MLIMPQPSFYILDKLPGDLLVRVGLGSLNSFTTFAELIFSLDKHQKILLVNGKVLYMWTSFFFKT